MKRLNAGSIDAYPVSPIADRTDFRTPLTSEEIVPKNRAASALSWTANQDISVGKGATIEEFVAIAGKRQYIIDVAPWGEGRITVDGREIARIADAKDPRQASLTFG
jgi:hypothetical protein